MEYILIFLVLLVLFILIIFFAKTFVQIIFWYGVPYVPTSDFKIDKFIEILEVKLWQKFLDLWSWDGRILEAVSKKNSGVKLFWIENSFLPYRLSLKRKKKNSLDYTVYRKDFFKEDFSKYDVIYSYTITYLMKKIWKKIKAECKPGTLFYSNSFEIKWEKPFKSFNASETSKIYVYKV